MCAYKKLPRHCDALAAMCLQYRLPQAPLAIGGGSNIFASVVERLASGLTVWNLCKRSNRVLGDMWQSGTSWQLLSACAVGRQLRTCCPKFLHVLYVPFLLICMSSQSCAPALPCTSLAVSTSCYMFVLSVPYNADAKAGA